MKKETILFDIDGTLIDSVSMAEMFRKKIAQIIKISVDEIKELSDKYIATLKSRTDFHPFDLIKFINKTKNQTIDSNDIFFKSKNIYKKYIYNDVVTNLDKLKNNYNLGVFSEGFRDYQGQKIATLIDKFDKNLLFITRRKLDNEFLKQIPKETLIIDDKQEVVETLKQFRPDLELVWINRDGKEKIKEVRTIKSLDELI